MILEDLMKHEMDLEEDAVRNIPRFAFYMKLYFPL